MTVANGSVTNNNLVWKKLNFSPVTTAKVRVLVNSAVDGVARIAEVEAWGTAAVATNVALASNGGVASASSTVSTYVPNHVNDGSRRAVNGSVWADSTWGAFPDWVEVEFDSLKTISEIDVITQQDEHQNPVEPTLAQTFSLYGITSFNVQYWNGASWVAVPGASITGNNKVWKQFTFSSITTKKVRVLVNACADNIYSRVVELEAWGIPVDSSVDPSGNNFSTARLAPGNRTGQGGVDLLSGNASWILPVLNLPGSRRLKPRTGALF